MSGTEEALVKVRQRRAARIAPESEAPPDTRLIPGLEHEGYRIGRDGRFWSGRSGKWRERKHKIGACGFRMMDVVFGGEVMTVAIANCVLKAFVGPREIRSCPFHKDRDRSNCHADNLMWAPVGTCKIGQPVKVNAMKIPRLRGSQHPNSKLSEDQLIRCRDLYLGGFTLREIAEIFDVAESTVKRVLDGKRYSGVLKPIKLRSQALSGDDSPLSKLNSDDVEKIRRLIAKGLSLTAIAKQFGVTYHAIRAIKTGRNWKPSAPATSVPAPPPSAPPHGPTPSRSGR